MKTPIEASQALAVLQRYFENSLLAAYLHGSAVTGGLHPNSDVDLLVVINRPTTKVVRERLVAELMRVSGRYPPIHPDNQRPLEVIVFQYANLAALAYPARSELVYGEWLRDDFEAGDVPMPVSDPDFTLLLAQARNNAIALIGPPAKNLLPIVPQADIRRAIGDALPTLLDSLEGDERNVLLTLARMWHTLAEGDFVPKNVAAEWAIPRLPDEAAGLLAYAREGYLGLKNDNWLARRQEAKQVANNLGERVTAILSSQGTSSIQPTNFS